MQEVNKNQIVTRLLQIGVALIPATIGILALVNDIYPFHKNVNDIAVPLITMQGITEYSWRALPASLAPLAFTIMFLSEFLVGVLAVLSIICMLRNICKPYAEFEKSKTLVYWACLWGAIVWGVGFFELGGDWFLAWMGTSPAVSGIQQGSLMYISLLFFTFVFLKLSKENISN
ncbi:DUF2165 family protein [Rickettsiales bacterium LUAb2]